MADRAVARARVLEALERAGLPEGDLREAGYRHATAPGPLQVNITEGPPRGPVPVPVLASRCPRCGYR